MQSILLLSTPLCLLVFVHIPFVCLCLNEGFCRAENNGNGSAQINGNSPAELNPVCVSEPFFAHDQATAEISRGQGVSEVLFSITSSMSFQSNSATACLLDPTSNKLRMTSRKSSGFYPAF